MKLLVEIFKLLRTKCTYWVTADTVYLNFFLLTWQMKLRFGFGAKQQHKIMVPSTQAWTHWWRRRGLTCLAGRGGLSEADRVLEMQETVQYVDLSFSTLKKDSAIFIVEERIQTAKCLSSCRAFF